MNRSSFSCVRNLLFVLLVIFIFPACTTNSKKEVSLEIAQWRGDNRDGIYNEEKLLNAWSEGGPELLWVAEGLGKGYAAPVVTNDKIFVNGEQDSTSFLFAYDVKGNLLWKVENGVEFMGEGFSATYPGARSTPTIVGNLIYATSGKGRIACFNVQDGAEKWAVNIVNDFGGMESYFGYAESVVVDEKKVYCFPGGTENNNVALDRFNGEVIWSSKAMQDTFSYCSPVLVELAERKVIVTHSRHNLYAIDTESGSVLGSYILRDYKYDGEHCNSPLYADGNIYFVGNEKENGAVKLALSADGENMTQLWQNSKVKNNFNGYVKVDNHLFCMVKGNWLKALDIETGAVTDSTKAATGSIIFADNKFICYGMNGTVNQIVYENYKFSRTGTFKVKQGDGQHFAHPVIKNGVLYIRHGSVLLAYKLK